MTGMNDDLRTGDGIDSLPEVQKKESSGEYLLRVLKPAGAILVVLLFVLYMVFCLTYRSDPADAPQSSAPQTEQAQTEN